MCIRTCVQTCVCTCLLYTHVCTHVVYRHANTHVRGAAGIILFTFLLGGLLGITTKSGGNAGMAASAQARFCCRGLTGPFLLPWINVPTLLLWINGPTCIAPPPSGCKVLDDTIWIKGL